VHTTCLLRLLTLTAVGRGRMVLRKVKRGRALFALQAPIQCREILMSAPTRSVAASLAKSISNFCQ
jgi:hypothetical protein